MFERLKGLFRRPLSAVVEPVPRFEIVVAYSGTGRPRWEVRDFEDRLAYPVTSFCAAQKLLARFEEDPEDASATFIARPF